MAEQLVPQWILDTMEARRLDAEEFWYAVFNAIPPPPGATVTFEVRR